MKKTKSPRWTKRDEIAAQLQGWSIFESDKYGLQIEKIDDAQHRETEPYQRFDSDSAAQGYVVGRADMGCRLAQKALAILARVEEPILEGRSTGDFFDWGKLIA